MWDIYTEIGHFWLLVILWVCYFSRINTLCPGQNGCHFKDDISNIWISNKILLKYVPVSLIDDTYINIVSGYGSAIRHQAITWANVDQYLCHHIASLGHNALGNLFLDIFHVDKLWGYSFHLKNCYFSKTFFLSHSYFDVSLNSWFQHSLSCLKLRKCQADLTVKSLISVAP